MAGDRGGVIICDGGGWWPWEGVLCLSAQTRGMGVIECYLGKVVDQILSQLEAMVKLKTISVQFALLKKS